MTRLRINYLKSSLKGYMGKTKDIENVPLSSLLEDYFDTSKDSSAQWPKDVKEWIRLVFIPPPIGPGEWEELDPDERRSAAVQWDEDRAFEQSPERKIAWYDQVLRASFWWKRASVSPAEAALLLCHQDPNDAGGTPLLSTNDETTPEHYKELLRLYQEVSDLSPGPRRLEEWVSIAQENELKHHSWVTEYAKAISKIALEDSVGDMHTAEAAEAAAKKAAEAATEIEAEVVAAAIEAAEAATTIEAMAVAVAAQAAAATAALAKAATAAIEIEAVAAAGLMKREQQVRAIVAAVEKLGYPALCIPRGGKKQLMKECRTTYIKLFGSGDFPFLDAWKVAVKQGLVRVANHSAYSGK